MSDYAADVMSIETFFSGNTSGDGKDFPLRIPDLQRSFVWGPAAVRGFWEDMQDHRLAKANIHEMFGGTVVLYTPPTPASGGTTVRIPPLPELKTKTKAEIQPLAIQLRVAKTTTPYNKSSFIKKIDKKRIPSEVIDGQQRLTVLMIGARILDEMGDVKKCQQSIRLRLKRIYRRYRNPRLEHLGSNETVDFKNVLNNHSGVDKLTTGWSNGGDGTPIKAAYEATLKYFKGFIKGAPLKKRWKEFSEFMLEETTIVCLETTEFHQSHLVFKSLNWKGRKLRTSELFKSILFHFSALNEPSSTNRDKIKQSWNNIVSNCTSARPTRGDAVSEFLHDWCRSVGLRRSDATDNVDHADKELKLDETLTILEKILKSECPRGKTNTGKVLEFIKKLEDESGRYAGIWKPTSALNSRTNQWIDLIDLRRIFSQGGLTPILLFILRQTNKADRDHGIRVLMQCTIFAVIPEQQRLAGGNAFSASDFAKETRMWVKDLQHLTRSNRLQTIKHKARTLLEKERLYSFVSGNIQAIWIREINKRWKSTMTLSEIDPGSAKLLLRYIEGIDIVAPCPIALDYKANYDKDRLEAEHIFPKSAKWGTLKKSDWRKEWDDDNLRWPVDEDERNSLKWRIGNYILLEKEVNNACKARTWKGYPRVHAPSKAPPKYKRGRSKGKQNFTGFGKIHFYNHYQWIDEELTGPLGLAAGTVHKGSQLQCVENLVKSYRSSNCWTQTSVKNRTTTLLTKAIGPTCPNIDLNYLW